LEPNRILKLQNAQGRDVKEIAEDIPNKTTSALFLIKVPMVKDLKQALNDAGGFLVGQGMLTQRLFRWLERKKLRNS